MQFRTIAMFVGTAIAIAAPAAIAAPSQRACGNHETAPAAIEQALGLKVAALRSAKQAEKQSSSDSNRVSSDAAFTSASIPVYWHVITDGTNGKLTSSQISSSIQALNSGYSATGLSFYLAGSETTTNSNWFNNVNQGISAEAAMKNTLRKGGANALNIYTVNFAGGLLGYATFPWNYNSAPKNDGIALQWTSYPGGPIRNYNQGKTLVHEGGCSGQGDYVDDTPPQSTATNGCPTNQDSCSGGGLDSVTNFMDYSYDRCMVKFSSQGQIARMGAAMNAYRL
ncbi:related to metalloprotease MEP1 [Ustilago bromivora]|uniref:Related to metalloprotease MEP1 n=1 Tax=Ustilago bromivora TaxID=307758 RepID=A0A8H8QJE1_9BASI|nr:related to metalloprotease MEP1 [Ustilago bromivora]